MDNSKNSEVNGNVILTGELVKVGDFLPSPELLLPNVVKSDKKVLTSIFLSKNSVDYFKKLAKKHGVKYQKIIREVLNRYVEHFEIEKSTNNGTASKVEITE